MLSIRNRRVVLSSALLVMWLAFSLLLPALAQAYATVCDGQASCCAGMADDSPVPQSHDQGQAGSPCPLKLGSQYLTPLLISPIQMTLLVTEPVTATPVDDEPRPALALKAIFHPPR